MRCLSEKPPEKDGKIANIEEKDDKAQNKTENATEKIQALLKSMMAAPKISENEYTEKFTVAPERNRKPKGDEIERKTQKIGK